MNLSGPFIARPIATSLIACGIAISGITAFNLLPVSSLPKMDFPTISVQASLPGASPEVMATSVATPLERQLGSIAGITDMTSSSTLGSTRIVVQFDVSRDINGAARDVQAAINASLGQLPTNLPGNPTYRKINPAEAPIMLLTLTSDTASIGELFDVGSTILEQKLSQVDGIGEVDVFGSSLPAVRVKANPNTLNNYGISLEQVAQAISSSNANIPKGQINIGNLTSDIISNDQLFNIEDYKKLIISYKNGAAVRLSDVAELEESVENILNAGLANNKRAIVLALSKEPGSNVIQTVDNVKAMLPLLRALIPAEVNLDVIQDRTITIRASLLSVEMTLLMAIILVIAVVYVFLGSARAALIPSVAVPLSLCGTFGIMYLCGFSLDNLSLIALTIVTGFVVDDAVVVLENITRHIEAGMKPMQAALQGTKEVGFTVLSMSISLIAVFIPILLMGGIIGKLLREFAATLSIAILVSLMVSLTVTPMMCSVLLKRTSDADNPSKHKGLLLRMKSFYAKSLAWSLNHHGLILFLTAMTIVLSVLMYIAVPKGFFPQQDTGRIRCSIVADQDVSFKELYKKLERYIKIASEDPAVDVAAGFVGAGATGSMFLSLKPLEQRGISSDGVINRLRGKLANIPGATMYMQSIQDIVVGGRQGIAQFQYTLSGDSLEELNSWTPKVMAQLAKLPGIADINSDQLDHGLQSYVQIDRDTASRLGVSTQDIDSALYHAFGQAQVATLFKPMNQYHIILTVDDKYWQNPAMLDGIYVPTASGLQIPLSVLAKFTNSTTLLAVNHQGQFPSTTLSFNLLPGASLGDVVDDVNKEIKKMTLPTSMHGTFKGTAQAFQDSLATQPFLILAALVAVYIVLGILYESVIHPVTILSTLPSAGVGALLSLLITRTDLTVISLIGIILLIGIVKKNAIMMIDFAIHLKRTENKSSRDAIYEAAQLRFRPIMMTTMAALLGAVPLVLNHGVGFELRQPLGISIIGGLVLSQMLTLYTTPTIYLTLDKFSIWANNKWQALWKTPESIYAKS
jgi:hydrophobe/amphiphile efflux-1 (HAE1) family protein